jgi:hypothetical protein
MWDVFVLDDENQTAGSERNEKQFYEVLVITMTTYISGKGRTDSGRQAGLSFATSS